MKMFTQAGVLVALLAVTSVTARPSREDPNDDESPRFARTTSYHGANTRLTPQDLSDHRYVRPDKAYPDVDVVLTQKTEANPTDPLKNNSQVNLKITEPVLKHVHEHVPTTPSTRVSNDVMPLQIVALYDQQPGVNAISSDYSGTNSPILAAIRNYENPITSYLKNNPLDGRQEFINGGSSHIRRQIIHQQTIISPYSQYYQEAPSQSTPSGYLIINPTAYPSGGHQQNKPVNSQMFENNPNPVGSNIRPQNGYELTGFQNAVQNENNMKPVLSQNLQVNSNTLPLVRPSYQDYQTSQNNNYNTQSRVGSNIGAYSTIYGTGNSQQQQYNGYRNAGTVSPYTGVIFHQNSQKQNYGNVNSNVNNEFSIMQPPSIQYTSNAGVNSYLASPSYANYRSWRPSQPVNSLEYVNSQNMGDNSQSVNMNTQQMMDGRQLSIPWPLAQYFPIVIKDPLVSMLSGFTSMIEYGPTADVCKPLDSKIEGNALEKHEEVNAPVDNSSPTDKEQEKDMKTRAKRLLDVEAQKVKAIETKNAAKAKTGEGIRFEKHPERQDEKLKTTASLKKEIDLTVLKPPPVIQPHHQSQASYNGRTNVEISRSIELDVGKLFNEGRLHQLGFQSPSPPPQPRPAIFAPQVSESKTVETQVVNDSDASTSKTPKTTTQEPETRNAKDEFEIINVNLPKQDGGLFQGRQDVPDAGDVELINVDRKPGNRPPVVPALVPEGKISDDVELIDVTEPKMARVESFKEKDVVDVELESDKERGVQVINKDQSLSATLEVPQDDSKEEGEENAEKESEDEDAEDEEDETSEEEDDKTKPDVEVQTEPPTDVAGEKEDPKQEEPGVILTTGTHGNYGPVIRRLIVRKGGVAIAGPGGIATAGPGGVAVVGPGGTAYTRPNGVAIVGPGGKVVGLPNGMVFEHGGVAVIHTDGSEPRRERVTTDKDGLPPGARVLAYGPTVYFHPPDLLI